MTSAVSNDWKLRRRKIPIIGKAGRAATPSRPLVRKRIVEFPLFVSKQCRELASLIGATRRTDGKRRQVAALQKEHHRCVFRPAVVNEVEPVLDASPPCFQ